MTFSAILFATVVTLILFVGTTYPIRFRFRSRMPSLLLATMMIQEVTFFITMLRLWMLLKELFGT